MAYCINCGAKFPKGAIFCLECGTKLKNSKSTSVISDSVIQRSTVGQASVGSVHVAPSMKQEVYGTPTCSNCGNILSEANILQYCKLCNKDFCKKCPERYSALVDNKNYKFEYSRAHHYSWTERVKYGSGDNVYYVNVPKYDCVLSSTYVEILKNPLCDNCYDKVFTESLIALKKIVRNIINETNIKINDLKLRGMSIGASNSNLKGVDPHFENTIINELEGCEICNGTGNCQTCMGTGDCQTCNGSGRCTNCNGTGICVTCKGTQICYECKGKGKGLIFKCSRCKGTGRCNCYNGKDYFCKGTGTCNQCEGHADCSTCSGTGNCTECKGSGNIIVPLRSDTFGDFFKTVRKKYEYDSSIIYVNEDYAINVK